MPFISKNRKVTTTENQPQFHFYWRKGIFHFSHPSTWNLLPGFIFFPPALTSVQVCLIPTASQLSLEKWCPHPCHVDMSFQCSSQRGLGCSKGNLVSEVLKQRTGKAVLCGEIWFIFLKIQLTHPPLPWQMPCVVWTDFFLLPPSSYCTPH